jgi:death-on-curing protein
LHHHEAQALGAAQVGKATTQPWIWLNPQVLLAVHQEQLAEHGGTAGMHDIGLFELAVERPRHIPLCGEPDACDLAAAQGFGIARNHRFADGNKRTAFLATELLLMLNGSVSIADDAACVMAMLAQLPATNEETK